jgi:predicted dehydrogenase
VWRHGSKHLHDTLPFLKAKIPAFVDKPLASSVADATELINTAEQAGVGFTSFSTLRYAKPTVEWVASLPDTTGELVSGMSTGHADLSSEYDGVFFYGIHAVELMVATFGYGCRSVTATARGNDSMAVCSYATGPLVTLNLPSKASYVFHLTAYGAKGWSQFAVDSSTAYYDGMTVFMECLRTGKWPLTKEQLLEPIKILTAINTSLSEKREVLLEEL